MSCLLRQVAKVLVQAQEDGRLKRHVLLVGVADAIAIVAITIVAYSCYKWWRQGPKVHPVEVSNIGSMFSVMRNAHRLPDYVFEVLRKIPSHTSRFKLLSGSDVIITANPANVEHILKTNFENYPKGERIYKSLHDLLGDGIFTADDHLWKVQRKVASHEFTTRSLRDFVLESTARETSDRLVPILCQASQSGQVLDMQDIFARFAIDSICQLGFGEDPKCLDISLPQAKFAEAFERASLLIVKRNRTPRIMRKVQRALAIGDHKELRHAVRVIDEFAMRVIKNRRQELALISRRGEAVQVHDKADLLSRFMTLMESGQQGEEIRAELSNHKRKSGDREIRSNNNINDVFLRDIVISFILAGRDTTTSALSWFFWLLSLHPNVELAILDEISRVLSFRASPPHGSGLSEQTNSGKSSSTLSFEELKSMHYLHAALTESMRLHPPVPSDLKTARKADVWPDGTVIHANSLVIYHPYAMGRLEDLWGEDALMFKPERWLDEEGIFVQQSPYKYTVFQAGPRMCLGKEMVMLQMKLTCAAILRSFEICVPKSYKPEYIAAVTMRLKNGLPMTVRKRTNATT